MRTLALSLSLVSLLAAGSALAQATPAGRLRQDTEDRARRELSDLFGTLCPEQCVLLSAQAVVDEEPVSSATPGFEGLSGAATLPVLKTLTVSVLVDNALPPDFRGRVKGLATQRLAALANSPTVQVQTAQFPPKLAPPPKEPEKPEAKPEPPKPSGDEKPLPLKDRLASALVDAAPVLAVVALLTLALLAVAALLVLAVRRASAPPLSSGDQTDWETDAAIAGAPLDTTAPPAASASSFEQASFPEHRLRRLERAMVEARAIRNTVIRDAMRKGETPKVALWTREFGQGLLDDVRGEAFDFQALGDALAQAAQPSAEERAHALHELEGRMLAASLLERGDPAEQAFGFLHGVPPDRFAGACRDLPPPALEVALRYAKADQRAAVLGGMDSKTQVELAMAWARKPEVSTRYALAVAEDLRGRVAETAGGAAQSETLLRELMAIMPRADQDQVAQRLAADSGRKLIITESTLAKTPQEILAAALLQLPPARLVSYLGGAEDTLRERLLAACPARIRGEIREELETKGKAPREEFLSARQELLEEVRREIGRRGVNDEDVSGWRSAGGA